MDIESLQVLQEIIDPKEAAREAWLERRRGKITGSHFGELMSVGRGKDEVFSQTGLTYLRRVAAERFGSFYQTSARSMEWGTENEAQAVGEYSLTTGDHVNSDPFQFFEYTSAVGCTPDGLVDDVGCIEVKCPYDPAVHVNTLLTGKVPKEYEWQVLGHLLCTGRQWCDFISFDPRMERAQRLFVIRTYRDASLLSFLHDRIAMAVDTVNEFCIRIQGMKKTGGAA
jgi:hypothetical protein